MPRVVILGTGTEVGKTYVTTALLRALLRRGLPAAAAKPIETGITPTTDAPPPRSDCAQLEAVMSGPPPRPHPLYAFPDPISPHLAARRANVTIDPERISDWVSRTALQYTTTAWLLLETAGGAFTPLSDRFTNSDLANTLSPDAVLLVAPDSLGVLHDASATIAALRSRALAPSLVVLTQARAPDASTGTNAPELLRLGVADTVLALGPDEPADKLLEPLLGARRSTTP